MPKIVILGSLKHHPYEVLYVPHPVEEGREEALQKCAAAIDRADEVVVYAREGIGVHTWQDIYYALQQGKRITVIGAPFVPDKTQPNVCICVICGTRLANYTQVTLKTHADTHKWLTSSEE